MWKEKLNIYSIHQKHLIIFPPTPPLCVLPNCCERYVACTHCMAYFLLQQVQYKTPTTPISRRASSAITSLSREGGPTMHHMWEGNNNCILCMAVCCTHRHFLIKACCWFSFKTTCRASELHVGIFLPFLSAWLSYANKSIARNILINFSIFYIQ